MVAIKQFRDTDSFVSNASEIRWIVEDIIPQFYLSLLNDNREIS